MPPKPTKSDRKNAKNDHSSLYALESQLKKKELGQLYVFHGEEAYLRNRDLEQIRTILLPPGSEVFNYKLLEGKDVTLQEILAAADCFPMMAERTLVVVKDFDLFKLPEAQKETVLDYLADLPEYLCLIFVYDLIPFSADARTKLYAAVKEHGLVVDFVRQDQDRLVGWIVRHFQVTGHDIDSKTAEYLIFLCGDLMHDLASEIGKIGAYAKDKWITRQDIDAVATPQLDAVVFQLNDHLGTKHYDKALSTLSDLLHMQESPQDILGALARYLRQLYVARVAVEERHSVDELIALWKMHPYPASKLMSAAHRVNLNWCRGALEKVQQADLRAKSTGANASDVLTELVLSLAHG